MTTFRFVFLSIIIFSLCGRAAAAHPASGPAANDSLVQLAARMYSDGDYQHTVALTAATDSNAVTPALWYYTGMSYAALYEYPLAQECLSKAIRGDSANVKFRYQYGRLMMQSGFPDEAVNELSACVRLDSTYTAAAFQLGLLYNALKSFPAKEAEVFSFLVRQNPNDFLSLYYAGDALRRLGFPDSGIQLVHRSIALNPRFFPSLIAAAHYENAKPDFAKALEMYLPAELLRPNDKELLFSIGECYRRTSVLPKAVAYFRKAIAKDSTNAVYHAQLGYAYFTLGRIDSAIASYSHATAIDTDNVQYYMNLALAYKKIDSVRGVIDAYQHAIQATHPENVGYAWNNLAQYYYTKAKNREAAEAYGKAFDYNPSNDMLLFWSADRYAVIPDNDAALAAYDKLLKVLGTTEANARKRQDVSAMINALKKRMK